MSRQQWDYVKEKKRMLMYIRGSDTIELNPYILVHNKLQLSNKYFNE